MFRVVGYLVVLGFAVKGFYDWACDYSDLKHDAKQARGE